MINKNILFGIFLIIVSISVLGINTSLHENAHKQIDLYNGCESAIITYGFWGGSTQEINCVANENRAILNTQNEIIGYNISSIIYALLLCTLIIGITIINKN